MPLSRTAAIVAATTLALAAAACESPSRPSISVVAGHPTSPSTDTAVSYYSQPVTLTVAIGIATGGASPTTTVEVANDPGFAAIVKTQTVVPDASGHATLTLAQLAPSTTYYWRVKTTAGDNPGATSSPQSFSIGPLLVIQPPAPLQPLSAVFTHKRPTFIVTDATHTGPGATLTYRFDIATDATFGTVVVSGTVPEAAAQTAYTPSADLTPGATYYWRAQASDSAKGVTSAYSTPQMFATVNPDDGTFRYDLTLHIDSLTDCIQIDNGRFPIDPAKLTPSQSFDANLVVSGEHLQYVVPHVLLYGTDPAVKFDLQRSGNQVSGTFAASLDWPGASKPYGTYFSSESVSAATDAVGRLTGTVRGGYDNEGFPSYVQCNVQLGFVLAPH